ncbi:MAG: hypothetical protein L0Z62_05750 [Gemmataceae bacterium]|nr:hypothetical protein [Gemmataceae bacterium]
MKTASQRITPGEARELILSGEAPEGMTVSGRLDLSGTAVTALPPGLSCYHLDLARTPIRSLPGDLAVEYKLDLTGCTELTHLPANLKVGSLVLRDCTAVIELPEGLEVYFLDVRGCVRLAGWPERMTLRIGRLNASGCARLTELPRGLRNLSQLDVSGCASLTGLPEGLKVSSWLDVAGTQVTRLPASLRGVRLRWRGVPVDERIAFRPETITAQEILDEPNAELRRVKLERCGFERFLQEAKAEVLDRDRDTGGPRQLLRVPLPGDEDLVCVSVYCPSTRRHYLLRVPPTLRTCRQAVAWTAGFDDPDDYRPLMET